MVILLQIKFSQNFLVIVKFSLIILRKKLAIKELKVHVIISTNSRII